jgi:hypothetical protein
VIFFKIDMIFDIIYVVYIVEIIGIMICANDGCPDNEWGQFVDLEIGFGNDDDRFIINMMGPSSILAMSQYGMSRPNRSNMGSTNSNIGGVSGLIVSCIYNVCDWFISK